MQSEQVKGKCIRVNSGGSAFWEGKDALNERQIKDTRKGCCYMEITKEKIIAMVLLLIRLCWPAVAFIGLCTAMFIAFDPLLLWLDQVAHWFIGGAWLSLLIVYILLGIALILFSARQLRGLYGAEAAHVQGRMAVLSGLPFYSICLLFLMTSISVGLDPNAGGAAAFFSFAGFFGFVLISFSYVLLLFFFLGLKAQIASTVTLLIRVCWPAIAFIVLCTGPFFAFNPGLFWFNQIPPWIIGGGWLPLLIVYILLGVAFTFFSARWLRSLYGSETVYIQGCMAILSGLPFYALCLFLLVMGSMTSFVGFVLTSLGYVLLLFFFLDLLRPTVMLVSSWRVRKS